MLLSSVMASSLPLLPVTGTSASASSTPFIPSILSPPPFHDRQLGPAGHDSSRHLHLLHHHQQQQHNPHHHHHQQQQQQQHELQQHPQQQQQQQQQQQLKFQLTGLGTNQSFEGTILFRNWSLLDEFGLGGSWYRTLRSDESGDSDRKPPRYLSLEQQRPQDHYVSPYAYREDRRQTKNFKRAADVTGATYYVVAVVLVYGMSIVLLIASHIKRKHSKVLEDVQINKYLQEFQVFREKSSRDNYRSLKHDIAAKLKQQKERPSSLAGTGHHHHGNHNNHGGGHNNNNGLGARKSSCSSLLVMSGGSSGSSGGNGCASTNGTSGAQMILPTINENGANCTAEIPGVTVACSKASINNSGSTGHLFALASRKKHSFAFLHSANFKRTTTSTSLLSGQIPDAATTPVGGPRAIPDRATQWRPWTASSLPTANGASAGILRRNQSISLLDRNQRVVVPAPSLDQTGQSAGPRHPPTTWADSKRCAAASVDGCQPSFCIVNEEGLSVDVEGDSLGRSAVESSQSTGELADLAHHHHHGDNGESPGGDPEAESPSLLTVQPVSGYRRVSCPYVQLVTGS